MGQSNRLTLERRQKIYARQGLPGWRSAYTPSILATREEAPRISRAIQLWSPLLGRYCHLLSSTEALAAVLALYHPRLFELHEQRMLCVDPHLHPIAGHPCYAGLDLAPLKGTLDVAARLDALWVHPLVHFDEAGESKVAPFPFIGDLLLFLTDDQGPYCVNWTVKGDAESFKVPLMLKRMPVDLNRAKSKERLRHAIEVAYYRDAGIRTQRVVKKDLDDELLLTLRSLLQWTSRAQHIPESAHSETIERFRMCIETGEPPLHQMLVLRNKYGFSIADLKALLFSAVWRREIRVDLWSPIFVDRPLKAETKDVLRHYENWFARGDQHE